MTGMQPKSVSLAERLAECARRGMTPAEAARACGCSRERVRQLKHALPWLDACFTARGWVKTSAAQIVALRAAADRGLTRSQAAAEAGLSRSATTTWAQRLGLRFRDGRTCRPRAAQRPPATQHAVSRRLVAAMGADQAADYRRMRGPYRHSIPDALVAIGRQDLLPEARRLMEGITG